MEDQASYLTTEPRYTPSEVLTALRELIAEKNLRMGMPDLFFQDRVCIELVSDTFKKLKKKTNEPRNILTTS
jgi:hypothetical protein